jgi:uncharacterized protein (TIGR02466 family)
MTKQRSELPGAGPPNRSAIRKQFYFPTPIYFWDVDEAAGLNTRIVEHIQSWRAETPEGIVRTNVDRVGAWHSEVDMHRRSEYRDLTVRIFDAMDVVFTDQGYDPAFEPAIDLMWANISPRFGFNRHHTHPGVLWSGVYYVRAPENSGRIFFTDPRPQAHVIEPHFAEGGERPSDTWDEVYYDPIEGRMILFPAWLRHEVEPNLAEGEGGAPERISISFNVFQRRKGIESDAARGPIVRADIDGSG